MSTREIIEMLCSKKGISVRKLERDLELSNGSISKTDTPKADKLLKISDYFGVSMNYLMTGNPDQEYYHNPETALFDLTSTGSRP